MIEDLLNEVSIGGINSSINSAYMASLLEEQKKQDKEIRKQEEFNSPSNQSLQKILKINELPQLTCFNFPFWLQDHGF